MTVNDSSDDDEITDLVVSTDLVVKQKSKEGADVVEEILQNARSRSDVGEPEGHEDSANAAQLRRASHWADSSSQLPEHATSTVTSVTPSTRLVASGSALISSGAGEKLSFP